MFKRYVPTYPVPSLSEYSSVPISHRFFLCSVDAIIFLAPKDHAQGRKSTKAKMREAFCDSARDYRHAKILMKSRLCIKIMGCVPNSAIICYMEVCII